MRHPGPGPDKWSRLYFSKLGGEDTSFNIMLAHCSSRIAVRPPYLGRPTSVLHCWCGPRPLALHLTAVPRACSAWATGAESALGVARDRLHLVMIRVQTCLDAHVMAMERAVWLPRHIASARIMPANQGRASPR